MACLQGVALHQGTGTGHAGLLVSGRQDDDRLPQVLRAELAQRLDGQCQKGLHVRGAEAVESAVGLGQVKRVMAPFTLVPGYGIGVAGQHQPAGSLSEGGNQVGLVGPVGKCHDLDGEAGSLQPAGKQVDDRAVALVEFAADAADRGGADQVRDHGQQVGWALSHAIACWMPVSAKRYAKHTPPACRVQAGRPCYVTGRRGPAVAP
jgi:hypothetical protein